jgi:signal transduction histidine kinase
VKQSLQTKLFVSFMLVVALILAGFAVGASALVRQYFLSAKQQELVGKGQEMGLVLNDFVSGKLTAPELVELVDRIDGFLDARIWAVDISGRVIVMSTPRRGLGRRQGMGPGQGMGPAADMQQGQGNGPGGGQGRGVRTSATIRALLKDMGPVFQGQVLTRTFFHPYYGEDMMIVAVPIRNENGAVSGAVLLNAPVQGMDHFLMRIYGAIALTGLLALALTLFIVRRLSLGIVRPLRSMEETAASMAQGRYDRRVEVTTQDEVGQLGDSFNTLAQELANFVARTEQMEKLRRDFVANVSHELRTPLTIIRGYTEALRDGTVTDPEKTARFHQLIVSETERLERLIADLLDLSRLQAQQNEMELEPIPLPEVVDSVVAMLRGKAEAAGVQLSWQAEISAAMIRGNGDRLVQLLLILLDNALKYTPTGGKITVSLTQAAQQVILTVVDTGAGIPAEDLPLIWERFYKVDKAHTRENHGTGLGLSIAREIIDRHHAQVDVASSPGAGTTFTIRFPALTPKG